MSDYLLGIDGGNTGIKIVLFNREGRKIASESCPSIHLKTEKIGFEEYDAEDLWKQISQGIRKLLQASGIFPGDIRGIGVSTYGNGIVLLGENGRVAAPGIYSNDYRANDLVDGLKKSSTGAMIQSMTQGDIWGGQPAMLLRWFKTFQPEVYQEIKHILLFGGYIVYRLTGCYTGNKNSMGGSALLDMQTGDYSDKLMAMYGIEEMSACLPELIEEAGSIVGGVTKRAAEETGLAEGIPVSAGMMDNMACFVGSGADAPGILNMVAGSWCVNQMSSEKVIRGASANMFYIYPGKYLNCSWSGASANNVEWLYKTFGNSIMQKEFYKPSELYQKVDEIILKTKVPEELFYLPFVAQPSIHPCARAGFVGISLSTTMEEMTASVAEGIVFIHKYHMEFFKRAGFQIDKIRLTGGISKSTRWTKLFSNLLEVPVEVVDCDETGAHGAAIAAGVGSGVYESYTQAFKECVHLKRICLPDTSDCVTQQRIKYERWKKLAEAMVEFWEKYK